MSDTANISHTVIVSHSEAFGYVRAGFEVPDVKVETRVPRTPKQEGVLVAEHIGTLLREHQPEDGEITEFVAAADTGLRAAFSEPEGAVFVRVTTPQDDMTYSRLDTVAQLAAFHGEHILN
jgi:hypothetical protein